MFLIYTFIYESDIYLRPPASGKLTIAEKLSEQTGIALFHNHLSRDLVKDIYKDKLNQNYALVDRIRFDVLDYCSKNDTDLIFTYVYTGVDDDDNVHEFMRIIEGNSGKVLFVELSADRDDLIDRADNESRKRFKKLTDPEVMKDITQDMNIYFIPFVDPLKINTSVSTPDESVAIVIAEYDLALSPQVH